MSMNVVGISCCPTGIAHTYMVAQAISNLCKSKGWDVKIETQGQLGPENVLSDDDIRNADVIVFACGISPANKYRFNDYEEKIIEVNYDSILKNPNELLDIMREKGFLKEDV